MSDENLETEIKVRVEESMKADVIALAKSYRVKPAQIVRWAIAEYLKANLVPVGESKTRPPSVTQTIPQEPADAKESLLDEHEKDAEPRKKRKRRKGGTE